MNKVIIVDARRAFLDDMNGRMIIMDNLNFTVVHMMENPEGLHTAIEQYKPDIVAVCDNVLDMQEDWEYEGTVLVGYAITTDGKEAIARSGLLSYGIVKNTTHLVRLLSDGAPKAAQSVKPTEPAEVSNSHESRTQSEEKPETIKEKQNKYLLENAYRQAKPPQGEDDWRQAEERPMSELLNTKCFCPECGAPNGSNKFCVKCGSRLLSFDNFDNTESIASENTDSIPEKEKENERTKRAGFAEKKKSSMEEKAREAFNRDAKEDKINTTVVTVYAAKGGVGKTTIATQVATYLAMLPHRRGNYNVCIIDYNIDFGDVRNTLPLEESNNSMYEWAQEIRERTEAGEDPDAIMYTREEMEPFLTRFDNKNVNLSALLAPVRHEESMDIDRNELKIMLKSIIGNGGFDFVVCDTGNNTRDSSVLALEKADYILLVATQDATTALCNRSAQEALERFGNLDMNKIRLVVNNVRSARETGVSVQDVEDEFPFPCIARVKYDTAVIKANNASEPIVFNGNHHVTRELRNIITFLTGTETEATKPGMLAKLFWRK